MAYSEGDYVSWEWGDDRAYGTIQKRYTQKTTKTIKGNEVTRNGSDDDAAILIEQSDGDEVLKLESEVRKER